MRIDKEIARQHLATSRTHAQRLIADGRVRVEGVLVDKASLQVDPGADISVTGDPFDDYVGRGAYKLINALNAATSIDPRGKVCMDAGASTGGFTDVLLRRGAAKVYAVDVGHDQLDPRISADERVVVMEKTNIRYLNHLPDAIELIVGDLSFISLTLIIPALVRVAADNADMVLLVKPQFEVDTITKSGIVRDINDHHSALRRVARAAGDNGMTVTAIIPSGLPGRYGNKEYFMVMSRRKYPQHDSLGTYHDTDVEKMIHNATTTKEGHTSCAQ